MAGRLRAAVDWVGAMTLVVALGLVPMRAYEPVSVAGGSMEPALYPGDLVLVRRGAPAAPGDVVLIRSASHGIVLHRVVRTTATGAFVTRGDANPVADLQPAPPGAVDGKVAAVVPVGKMIARWRGASSGDTLRSQSHTSGR